MYTHITREERVIISYELRRHSSYREIANCLGRTCSTIYYEVTRNCDLSGSYDARRAHKRARERRKQSKVAYRLIENNPSLKERITELLDPLYSPETVAHDVGIHFQTIYSWIYRSYPHLRSALPYRGKKRRRYGTKRTKKQGWTRHVPNIEERPCTKEYWEGDTIKGSTLARALTHVEANSLFLVADVIPNGGADIVHEKTKQHDLRGSITYDRGSEFALWKMIERDVAPVYFAHPHHPWQRGKNENTNGRLRRVFPKRFNFATLSQRELNRIVHRMNNTPRKSLNWRTPQEVLNEIRSTSD
jgi:transposase, IS30 family